MMPIIGGALLAAIIGFLTGLLALLSQEGVTQLSDISELSLLILVVGSLLAFVKDFNAIWTRKFLGSKTGTNAGSPAPVSLLAGFLALVLISGCAGTKSAYRAAEGVDQTAKVVSEHYYALVREANELRRNGVLRGTSLQNAQQVVSETRPVILQMADVARRYDLVRNAQTQAELERAVNEAAIAVSRLVDIIKAWRQTSAIDEIETELDRIIQEAPPLAVAA